MKNKIIFLTTAITFIILSCTSTNQQVNDGNIIVQINYGEKGELKTSQINFKNKITALEALQKAAIVETHPVGDYVFVCSIDSVNSIRGEKAWYYKVNGKSPKLLAISNELTNGDTLLWIYKTDVCSGSVDNKK